MVAFVKSIELLGDQVAASLRLANGDLRRLPEIAEETLGDFDSLDGVDLNALVEFLERTPLRQQSKSPFSDLPVTVFQARDFYIELLVWSHATTAIHQHAFGGAFRVVRGSSIHSRYEFHQDRRISDDLLIGAVCPLGSERLTIGSVRRIDPGIQGLVHSLYHLDNPSISLIVRDGGHAAFGPQYNYYPPVLAFHRRALEADELVVMFGRLLELTAPLDRATFRAIWFERIARFEFPRLAWLYLGYHAYLDPDERAEFRICAEYTHGDLVPLLLEAVERYASQLPLARMRQRVLDAELRFFLALLMNVPDRENLLRMVAEEFPERDPVECCADWLVRLSVDEQTAVDRMKEVAQLVESSGAGAMQFSRQLRNALPHGIGFADAKHLFQCFIASEGKSANSDVPVTSFAALSAMPQLRALHSGVRRG